MSYRADALSLNPLLYWRLGEGAGTSAQDETTNGFTGLIDGMPGLGTRGLLSGDPNKAILFDGVDDIVSFTSATAFANITTEVSFVMWIKVMPHGSIPMALMNSSSSRIVDFVMAGSTINAHVASGAGNQTLLGPVVANNTRHMMGLTWKKNGQLRIYLDGSLAASAADTLAADLAVTDLFSVGGQARHGFPPTNLFTGVADEPLIFTRELSANEMLFLFRTSLLVLDFEPALYTTGDLNTQDGWVASPGKFSVTNVGINVINGVQSLEMELNTGGNAQRAFTAMQDAAFTWVWRYSSLPSGAGFPVLATFYTSSGNFVAALVWSSLSALLSHLVVIIPPTRTSIDLGAPTDDHLFTFRLLEGFITVAVDGQVVLSGPSLATNVARLQVQLGSGPITAATLLMDDIVGAPSSQYETLAIPRNVFAVAREHHAVVAWDRVTMTVEGIPLAEPVSRYEIYRSTKINEADRTLRGVVTDLDTAGAVQTVFIDFSPGETGTYRVLAMAPSGDDLVQSVLSEKAVAIFEPSQIDAKKELPDTRLLVWDERPWDDSIWA